MIRTITADIDGFGGMVLAHEHLQIDLSDRKGPETVLGGVHEADIIEDLAAAVRLYGLRAVVDLGAAGFGRDVAAYRRIAEGVGLWVVCATGYYWDPVPAFAETASVEALRERMVGEVVDGVDGTGLRCGVIKVGTGAETPSAATGRIFDAAAQAAERCGAAVVTHTTRPAQAAWQIERLRAGGLAPERMLISHLHGFGTVADLVEVGRCGVFMGIDQIGFAKGPSYDEYADLVAGACAAGLTRQLILSSDVARHTRLRRYGGTSYLTVFQEFLPRLRARGVDEGQIETMMWRNPERLLQLAA